MAGGLMQLLKSSVGLSPSSKSRASGGADEATPSAHTSDLEKFPDRPPSEDVDVDMAEGWVTSTFQKLKTAYLTYHQNIWQSILFYVGQSWLTWDDTRRNYTISVPEDDYTPMPKINYFAPAIDAMASNFKQIPQIEATARDADGDESYKRHGIAEVANRLAADFIMRTGLKSDFQSKGDKPSEAAQLFVLAGCVCTYVQARDLNPIQSDDLGDISQKTVECDLINPLYLLARPGSTQIGGLSGSPYMMTSRRMTLQEIYTRFQVNAEPDLEYLDGYNSLYQSALNYFYTGFNASDVSAEDAALCTEVFVPPSSNTNAGLRDFADKGFYGVYVNSKLKYAEPWAFPDHPLTKFDYLRVPTLFFGRTPAFDLCNLQEEIQSYESIIKLHSMCSAVSPWVVDANTLVSEITGRADKVIKYRSIGPNSPAPHREAPGSLDAGVYAQVKALQAQFESISGAASVFRGRQEGSVVAASAIAQLRGQAEQMFSGPVLNWNNGWKETVRKAVLFMQKCYTLPQILAITGETIATHVQDFISCDLDQCLEWIAADHGLPRSQDELRQEMLALFDKKALDINDPNVKERMFRLFGETGMLTMFNLDATRARMENVGMRQGKHPIFRPAIEDLQTHYAIHTEAVKSMEFDLLPPQVQEIFLAHVMETKQALMPPPPPPAPPPNVSITGKLEDLPPALTDAILESHGIHPPPPVPAPPPHHVGKPLPPGADAHPPISGHGGVPNRSNEHSPATLASNGHPTGTPLLPRGQGIHPIGTSQGAPPAPSNPLAQPPSA